MWHELQKVGCPVTTIEPAEKTAIAISISNNFARQFNCLNTFITDSNIVLMFLIIPLFKLANPLICSLDLKCHILFECPYPLQELRFFKTIKTK